LRERVGGGYIREGRGTADAGGGKAFGVMNDDATDDEHTTVKENT